MATLTVYAVAAIVALIIYYWTQKKKYKLPKGTGKFHLQFTQKHLFTFRKTICVSQDHGGGHWLAMPWKCNRFRIQPQRNGQKNTATYTQFILDRSGTHHYQNYNFCLIWYEVYANVKYS